MRTVFVFSLCLLLPSVQSLVRKDLRSVKSCPNQVLRSMLVENASLECPTIQWCCAVDQDRLFEQLCCVTQSFKTWLTKVGSRQMISSTSLAGPQLRQGAVEPHPARCHLPAFWLRRTLQAFWLEKVATRSNVYVTKQVPPCSLEGQQRKWHSSWAKTKECWISAAALMNATKQLEPVLLRWMLPQCQPHGSYCHLHVQKCHYKRLPKLQVPPLRCWTTSPVQKAVNELCCWVETRQSAWQLSLLL